MTMAKKMLSLRSRSDSGTGSKTDGGTVCFSGGGESPQPTKNPDKLAAIVTHANLLILLTTVSRPSGAYIFKTPVYTGRKYCG
ncbi:MAG: hypothetical protein CL797_07050 [Chromatiales bacterium]|jgi:hypothetical protein|nr:hypothetical protein [Chromatiales bacterium]